MRALLTLLCLSLFALGGCPPETPDRAAIGASAPDGTKVQQPPAPDSARPPAP